MRLPSLALATALAVASLTACSDDGGSGGIVGGSTARPLDGEEGAGPGAGLSQAELDEALLTTGNLSDQFEIDPEDSEEDDGDEPDLGCLFDFEDTGEDEDDEDEGEIAFAAKSEPGLPGVLHFLAVAASEEEAQQGLDQIGEVFGECSRVDTEEDDGTRWQLDVTSDDDSWADLSDAQVNMSAVGTLGMGSLELPLTIEFSVVRVDNAVSITAFFDISDDIGSAHRDVTDAATARLAAVLAGDEPPTPEPVLSGYPIGKAFGDVTEEPEIEV